MRAGIVPWTLCALTFALIGACSSSSPEDLFEQIDVTVVGSGGGSGQVVAPDPSVAIDCQFTAGVSNPLACDDTFSDAGGGGVFPLEATPDVGSTFGGWTGCSSSVGTVCTLTFAAGHDTSFAVSAHFDLSAGVHPKAEIRAYNGTLGGGVSVSLLTPYDGTQTLGPIGASVIVSDSMQVEVGVPFIMSSTIGTKTGSVTCTTTASIIPDPLDTVTTGNAMVAVFTDGSGTPTLSCIGSGWQ